MVAQALQAMALNGHLIMWQGNGLQVGNWSGVKYDSFRLGMAPP